MKKSMFEALSVDGYKRHGAEISIQYGIHDSPFGSCLIAITNNKICYLSFVDKGQKNACIAEMKNFWHQSKFIEDSVNTRAILTQLFTTKKQTTFALLVKGTDFQIQVWRALLAIPSGKLVSYEAIAKQIGNGKAVRAAASAIAKNSISYLIPCHRVISKTGKIGKYRWGSARKKAIIAWEQGAP